MPTLLVSTRIDPRPPLVTVAGEIDIATAPHLRDRVLVLPDGDVILDASRVRLLAVAGARTLLDLQGHRARAGARMVVAAPSYPVRHLLAVTGWEKALLTTDTVADALALLGRVSTRRAADASSADQSCRRSSRHRDGASPHAPVQRRQRNS